MINELLNYENQKRLVGLEIENKFHRSFQSNAKNGVSLLVKVSNNGSMTIEAQDEESHIRRRHYVWKNHNTGITFKRSFCNGKNPIEQDLGKIQRGIENTIKLEKFCKDDEEPFDVVLKDLISSLKIIDHKILQKELDSKFPLRTDKDNYYITFEIEKPIQGLEIRSLEFQNKFNERIFEIEQIERNKTERDQTENNFELDCLGSRNPIKSPFQVKIENIGQLNIYDRNIENDCYIRYGMNGQDLCSFSKESRDRLTRILTDMFSVSHVYRMKDCSLIFVCTLLPELNVDSEFSEEEWTEYSNRILDQIRKQQETSIPGEIIVFRKPANGPISIEYKKVLSREELAEILQQWNNGVKYFEKQNFHIKPKKGGSIKKSYLIPSIFGLTKLLSSQFHKNDNSYKSIRSNVWTLSNSLEMFFGSDSAYRKAKILISRFIPYFLECVKTNSDMNLADEMYSIFNVFGLILNKENILREELENNTMYCLGRLFYEADRMHERFHNLRKNNIPNELIGYRTMRRCLERPLSGFAEAQKEFQIFLNDAKRSGYYLRNYNEIMEKFIPEEIPESTTEVDKIALACGYAYRKPFGETNETQESSNRMKLVAGKDPFTDVDSPYNPSVHNEDINVAQNLYNQDVKILLDFALKNIKS